jgi:hypothetical protein
MIPAPYSYLSFLVAKYRVGWCNIDGVSLSIGMASLASTTEGAQLGRAMTQARIPSCKPLWLPGVLPCARAGAYAWQQVESTAL